MNVKVCPKCGAQNKITNAACSSCYVSLDEVAETSAVEVSAPQQAAPAAGQPASSTHRPPPARPPGVATQAPPHGSRPTPVGAKRGVGVVVGAIVLIAAMGAFAGWWFLLRPIGPTTPEELVERYLDACKAGDYEAMKSCVSAASIAEVERLGGGPEVVKRKLTSQAQQMGRVSIEEAVMEGEDKSTVRVLPQGPQVPHPELPPQLADIRWDFVCVREETGWKIDLLETIRRLQQQILDVVGTDEGRRLMERYRQEHP